MHGAASGNAFYSMKVTLRVGKPSLGELGPVAGASGTLAATY